jgi:hypothetical protein
MKPLHIGLLVIGAALAGGLAVRMAEPPPLPQPSRVRAAMPTPPPASAVATPPAVVTRPPAVQPAVIAPAPPPIYSEPSHVEQPARRKPPAEFAKAINPAVAPFPYEPPPAVSEPPHVTAPPPRRVVLPAGIPLTIRLGQTLSTEHAVSGDTFQATLVDPLVVDGLIVAERGARVTGRIADARRAGRMSGVSSLELRLLDVTTADGQRIAVSSDPWFKRGDKIGGAAVLGTIIGAIAGEGFGEASGAKPVTIPTETVIRFRLASRLTITERRL